MTQYADRMCRGGSSGPLRHVRAVGSLAARAMAVLAALLLVSGGGAMRAEAAGAVQGVVMVICSDGGAKTIVLDAEGNPVETSGEEACPGHGPCCTLPEGYALPPPAQAPAVWEPVASVAVFHDGPAVLRSGTGHGPKARGPPSKDNA